MTRKPSPINLFPNPAAEYLQIKIPNESVHTTAVLYDISGKTSMMFFLHDLNNAIDIRSLSPGMYFIHLDDTYEDAVFVKQ